MPASTKEQLKTQAVKSSGSSRPNWFVLLARIFAWQILAVLFVELTLFFAGLGEEEIFKLDPDLGVTHISNKKVTWRSEGFATSYLNNDGMREPGLKVAKAAGTYRVALMGDSLTESLQVPVEQSFGWLVQNKLKQDLSRPVQVINFGTSGYSTVQEYLQLKKKVLKYKPDLILLCYNSRDCFENWSPPDGVLTNVRPAALHLPGGKLIIDKSPIIQWMRSPRARFLKQFELVREQSRIWGLYAQAELDWSLHNETYQRIAFFISRPGKAIRQTAAELSQWWKNQSAGPSLKKSGSAGYQPAPKKPESTVYQPATGSDKADPKPTRSNVVAAKESSTVSATGPSNLGARASRPLQQPAIPNSAISQRKTYEYLIIRTLGSLLLEMKTNSASSGAKFAVVALPVRSDLSARQGMLTAFNDYTYNDELKMLQGICQEKQIPLINLHEQARSLKDEDRDSLFFLVHYTPAGHEFVAKNLLSSLKDYIQGAPQK